MTYSRDIASVVQRGDPRELASGLDHAMIHLWWLSRRRIDGREPLRRVLAAYLGVHSRCVSLRAGTHGRPELAGTFAGQLDFNWSHSGEKAVLAIARNLPRLGVDVQYVEERRSYMQVARRYFGADEYACLAAMPEHARAAGFVRLWTAKEAFVKANGRGLAYGLDKVRFAIRGGEPLLRCVDGGESDPGAWRIAHWCVPGNGFTTLCWHGGMRAIRHFMPVWEGDTANVDP